MLSSLFDSLSQGWDVFVMPLLSPDGLKAWGVFNALKCYVSLQEHYSCRKVSSALVFWASSVSAKLWELHCGLRTRRDLKFVTGSQPKAGSRCVLGACR